jgi:hypothetical protein
MEVSGQLHTPAILPPWKEPPVPIASEAERDPELSEVLTMPFFRCKLVEEGM